jgi:glycosyltransferase involved in cell wall biosynthesis
LPEDPETNHLKDENSRNRFHKLVFCGNWQYQRYKDYLGLAPSKDHIVIDTPIDPFPSDVIEKKDPNKINLVYTSTPQRGLEILVPIFEKLAETHKDIHLDVFSSFKIYGWDEADKNFEQMTYHGFQPNEVVREYVAKADILAYPSIWMECNSRSLIEAMSAGALCVHPNFAGLTDTSGNLTYMYQMDANHNTHANIFYHALNNAINVIRDSEDILSYLRFVKAYADSRYNWEKITSQWVDLLTALKENHKDVSSRKIPAAKFVYQT